MIRIIDIAIGLFLIACLSSCALATPKPCEQLPIPTCGLNHNEVRFYVSEQLRLIQEGDYDERLDADHDNLLSLADVSLVRSYGEACE